jgi:hypothetical protein
MWIVLSIFAIGGAVYFLWPSKATHSVEQPANAKETAPAAGVGGSSVSLREYPGDALAEMLIQSGSVDKLQLPLAQRDRLMHDAKAWIGASFSESHKEMVVAMARFDVQMPAPWASDPTLPKEAWKNARSNLLPIDFDPSRCTSGLIGADLADPFPAKSVQRCSRRDAARVFLTTGRASGDRDAFIAFGGRLREYPGEVMVAYRFAWRKETQQWVLIQVCLYDYPNEMTVYSMIL